MVFLGKEGSLLPESDLLVGFAVSKVSFLCSSNSHGQPQTGIWFGSAGPQSAFGEVDGRPAGRAIFGDWDAAADKPA